MDAREAAATIGATLLQAGVEERALGSVGSTILRPGAAPVGTIGALPPLVLDVRERDGAELVARSVIGRGGMGVVHLAEQRALGREVAVKTISTPGPSVSRALVREARIMGAIEHPNVVPVHALGAGSDGAPVLVMKRIEGVPWSTLLRSPDHAAWKPLLAGHGDRLRAHVEILGDVARALAFAHDRGIVHRDLKPENVMIGRFGEVYLLDWGIAVRLDELADEPDGICGTPGYMAPEMAMGRPSALDARTDVYLLGATLYEILSGRMPHQAERPMASLVHALTEDPDPLPAGAPRELASLVTAALARDKDARLPSAEAFREGLARWLASREADVLADGARAALARAETSLEAPDAFRALIEARFGLASALRLRPDDEAMRAELDRCVLLLAERELALRSPAGARAAIAELTSPPKEIVARIEALEREALREKADADAFARSQRAADSSLGLRAMRNTLLVSAVIALPVGAFLALESRTAEGFPMTQAVAFDAVLCVVLAIALFVGRRAVLATAATKRITAWAATWMLAILVSDSVTWARGGTTIDGAAHAITISLCIVAVGTITILRDLWPMIPASVVALGAVLAFPESATGIALLSVALTFVLLARAIHLDAERTRVSRASAR